MYDQIGAYLLKSSILWDKAHKVKSRPVAFPGDWVITAGACETPNCTNESPGG